MFWSHPLSIRNPVGSPLFCSARPFVSIPASFAHHSILSFPGRPGRTSNRWNTCFFGENFKKLLGPISGHPPPGPFGCSDSNLVFFYGIRSSRYPSIHPCALHWLAALETHAETRQSGLCHISQRRFQLIVNILC